MSENNISEFDKIIDKFSQDLKNRIRKLVTRQEKKLVKELQIANKTSKKPKREDRGDRQDRQDRQERRGRRKNKTSSSTSESTSSSRSA
jgi:hypothetical protein